MAEEWNKSQDSMYNNLIGFALPGIKDPTPEKIAALENMCREIADSKNTNRVHAFRTVISSSLSKDPFEAWAEWQFSHARKSTDGLVEDCGSDEQATGSLYGRKLKKAYFFRNRKNPELPLLQMGGTLYALFKSSLEGFGTPTEEKLLSAREQKRHQVADAINDPEASLDYLIAESEVNKGIISDVLEIAKDRLVDLAAALGILRKISPELGRMRDPTRNIVHLQRGRSILSWYEAEQDDKSMPEYVRQAFYKLEDDLFDASPLDTFIVVNYAAKKRYVNRHSVLNGIDDDLLLMSPPKRQAATLESFGIGWAAPVVQRLVERYGTADLKGVDHLLEQENITEFEAANLLMLKPNVFDFRVDANSALDSSYAHNLSAIFDKVVP
ncbi:hypothetical protein KY363_06865, partial [Candidatus Woesearchaeota archaeon]|nr:hypothetical protein [Candidatus Woesearchaeota archaeon]